jgi:hypothetical protein
MYIGEDILYICFKKKFNYKETKRYKFLFLLFFKKVLLKCVNRLHILHSVVIKPLKVCVMNRIVSVCVNKKKILY